MLNKCLPLLARCKYTVGVSAFERAILAICKHYLNKRNNR